MKTLIHRIAEVGYLSVRVDAYVREREGRVGIGMIEQSLCHHLQSQLTEYYRLIAVLESQMSASIGEHEILDGMALEMYDSYKESTLTLKRLDVWIQEWRLRMRMMSVCVEGAQGRSRRFQDLSSLTAYCRRARRGLGEPVTWICG